MHKIFDVPELLDEIFSHSSKHTNTVAARVCQLWFTHSIPFIWDMVSLNDALKVLSPFATDSSISFGFQQPLSTRSWNRFSLYSKNVRQLQCLCTHYSALKHTVFWKPCMDLFSSKLTVLQWCGPSRNIEYLLPLLASSLQILHLDIDDNVLLTNPIDVLYDAIPLRSPSLRAFEFNYPQDDHDVTDAAISESLGKLLPLISNITILALPIYCITKDFFTILSQLPRLEDLWLFYSWALKWTEFRVEGLPKRQIWDEEQTGDCLPFQSLRRLDISDADRESDQTFTMARVLEDGAPFLKLTELICYYTEMIDLDHEFIDLMELVQIACPNVQKISIFTEEDELPWLAIPPLLNCPALVELRSNTRFDMSLEHIVTIATNRTSWKVINLPSPPLSYQALVVFAQNCPDLVELGLTLDDSLEFTNPKIPPPDVKFSSLNLLDVGDSPVVTSDSIMDVVTFLSSICRKVPKITCTATADGSMWMAVENMITLQLKNRELEDEITLLRAHVKDLTGMA